MPNDIEQLKQDFLRYLKFLVPPSPKILVEKIIPSFQETELRKITLKPNADKNLSIESKDGFAMTLSKNDFGKYGLCTEGFRKDIEDIKSKDPKKIFPAAVEEIIILHNKKLCKIYIPLSILIYTKLYEKFRLANPNIDRNGIHLLMDTTIENSLTDKPSLLIYNYFKRAYQGYENSTGFACVFGAETENLKIIFSITKELKLNFIPYQNTYTSLINLIEKFHIYAKDKEAAQILIEQLKYLTDCSFSTLIQKSFGKQNEKTVIKDFKLTAQKLIKNYIEDHPDECKKQRSILDCLLWFITKIIPESILSKNKRMSLFGKYTETGNEIRSLSNQVIENAINLVH